MIPGKCFLHIADDFPENPQKTVKSPAMGQFW